MVTLPFSSIETNNARQHCSRITLQRNKWGMRAAPWVLPMSASQEENVKLDTPWHYLIKHAGWLLLLLDPENPRRHQPPHCQNLGRPDRCLAWQNTFAKLLRSPTKEENWRPRSGGRGRDSESFLCLGGQNPWDVRSSGTARMEKNGNWGFP